MTNQTSGGGVSFRPSDMTVGGGLIDDVDLEVVRAEFDYWQYPGTSIQTIAARLIFHDDEGNEHEQMYTCGDPKNFAPATDKKRIVAVGQSTGLSDSTNFSLLIKELVNVGFDENRLSDDITCLVGVYGHWRRIPQPERKGVTGGRLEKNKDRESTILVCSELKEKAAAAGAPRAARAAAAPRAAARPAAAAQAPAAPAQAVAPVSGGLNGFSEVATDAAAYIKEALSEPPFELSSRDLAQAGFKHFSSEGHAQKTLISKALFDTDFLSQMAADGICNWDPETSTLTPA